MTEPDLRTQIVGELYRALERLDADEGELLSMVEEKTGRSRRR